MKKVLLIISALYISMALNAQGLSFVNIGLDPSNIAVAGTAIARKADAYAIENNIAVAALNAPKMAVSAGLGLWQPSALDARLFSAQGFYRIGSNLSVALQYKGITYPEYTIVSPDGRGKGSFSPREMATGIGVAYRLSDVFSTGVNIRLINSVLAQDAKGSAVGADFALNYEKDALQAGLSFDNIGTSIKYGDAVYSQPMRARVGVAYSLKGITLSTAADYYLKGALSAGIGAEYTLLEIVSLRAGYHYGNSAFAAPSYGSFGLGIHLYGAHLDFAYLASSSTLNGSLLISLGYAL